MAIFNQPSPKQGFPSDPQQLQQVVQDKATVNLAKKLTETIDDDTTPIEPLAEEADISDINPNHFQSKVIGMCLKPLQVKKKAQLDERKKKAYLDMQARIRHERAEAEKQRQAEEKKKKKKEKPVKPFSKQERLALKEQLLNWQNAVSWKEDDRLTSQVYSDPEDDFGMPEQKARELRELLEALGSDEEPDFTQGTRDKHQSLLEAFDPDCIRRRPLKGPQVSAQIWQTLMEEEKKEVEEAQRLASQRLHFKPRDRRCWPWMLDRVNATDAEARKRKSKTIGERIHEVQLHAWIRQVWGTQHVPPTYG